MESEKGVSIRLEKPVLFEKGNAFTLFLFMLMPLISANEVIKPPHIILIYVDDLGWNDVSFHGASDIPTPNIDALALNGIILNNYYGEWLCAPSRGALLTGKYPMRLGLQSFVILPGEASALPIEVSILPQFLKLRGYDTHIVGKWNLGFHKNIYLPSKRGFDTFFGYLNGQIDYYDYTNDGATLLPKQPFFFGRDLYNGTTALPDSYSFRGKYATYVFAVKATNIIRDHDKTKPLFLYLSHLAVHIGSNKQPLQAPPEVTSQFKYIKNVKRRIHAAKLSVLDTTVGNVFKALHRENMLENSIVLLMSDNGGFTHQKEGGYSSNYPLRGSKFTYWEGGIRLPALIWSPLLQLKQPRVSRQMMHVTDWLPTLYDAAGGNISDLGQIDGLCMWPALIHDLPSPRTQMLNLMEPIDGVSAYRMGDFKVVNGSSKFQRVHLHYNDTDTWFGPTGSENIGQPPSFYEWIFKNGSAVRDVLLKKGWWIAEQPDKGYEAAKVSCEQPPPTLSDCDPEVAPCLYNIAEDPCEYHNLAKEFPRIVDLLMSRVHDLSKQQMAPQTKPSDPRADPMCHNFTFVPWLDPEHYTECDYMA